MSKFIEVTISKMQSSNNRLLHYLLAICNRKVCLIKLKKYKNMGKFLRAQIFYFTRFRENCSGKPLMIKQMLSKIWMMISAESRIQTILDKFLQNLKRIHKLREIETRYQINIAIFFRRIWLFALPQWRNKFLSSYQIKLHNHMSKT